MLRMTAPVTPQARKALMMLVASVVLLDAAIIGIYYALRVQDRAVKTQQTFVAVWVVLTLIVVSTMLKRVRAVRRGR